jgi:hypothetical protein
MGSPLVSSGTVVLVVVIAAASFSAGWVLADARARGIPPRKALTWAALQFVEWPLFLWLYRRARPRTVRAYKPG